MSDVGSNESLCNRLPDTARCACNDGNLSSE